MLFRNSGNVGQKYISCLRVYRASVPLDTLLLKINIAYGVKSNSIQVIVLLCSFCMLLNKLVGCAFHFQNPQINTAGGRESAFILTANQSRLMNVIGIACIEMCVIYRSIELNIIVQNPNKCRTCYRQGTRSCQV